MNEENKSTETEEVPSNTAADFDADEIELPVIESESTNGEPEEENKKKQPFIAQAFEWAETFALAMSLMMLIFLFLFKYVTVDGSSMKNTLFDGEKLIISSLTGYERGDIVVFRQEGMKEPLVKRIIATGGQVVDIDFDTWEVRVDGELVDEPYILRESGVTMNRENFSGHVLLEDGEVFVMGDNRNGSRDSRYFGPIDARNILGKVVLRVFPFGSFGTVD